MSNEAGPQSCADGSTQNITFFFCKYHTEKRGWPDGRRASWGCRKALRHGGTTRRPRGRTVARRRRVEHARCAARARQVLPRAWPQGHWHFWISFIVAKVVYSGVLRTLSTVVLLDGQKSEQGDLCLTAKLDTANLEQKHSSHGVVWGSARLSSGLAVGRTRVLRSLGSK